MGPAEADPRRKLADLHGLGAIAFHLSEGVLDSWTHEVELIALWLGMDCVPTRRRTSRYTWDTEILPAVIPVRGIGISMIRGQSALAVV